ncbi:YiiX/YebB-like N1pC/P60 family cysteine hydrolase [Niabella insulamsoli]|uniref:YiiX/YebB-like N1pC/P60 family cysteine hydrolase n=1 Tax=Niabella insulamsoli TaxID=3144874 RepID=UPI0031FD7CCC
MACARNHKAGLGELQRLKPLLQSGDLIFRNGIDEVSEAARHMSRTDKSFSHCGIIQVEHDTVFVYHALGGRFNPSQKLLRQPLELFCDPKINDRIAVYRYQLNASESESLANWIRERYSEGLLFDLFFNLTTDDRMYCSEFVFKGLSAATNGALFKHLNQKDDLSYVTIDDLYWKQGAIEIFDFVF